MSDVQCIDRECLAPIACGAFGYCRQLNFPRDVTEILADPNAVHLNMLRGTIAKPSIEQIIHIYGLETIKDAIEVHELAHWLDANAATVRVGRP